jgi:hypothetical protein
VRLIFFSQSNDAYSYYLFRDRPTGHSASGWEADRTAWTAASLFESNLSHRFWRSIDVENTHVKEKTRKKKVDSPSGSSVLVRHWHHSDETKEKWAPRKIIQVYATTRTIPTPALRRRYKETQKHARTTCSDDKKANGCHTIVVCGQGQIIRLTWWRGLSLLLLQRAVTSSIYLNIPPIKPTFYFHFGEGIDRLDGRFWNTSTESEVISSAPHRL